MRRLLILSVAAVVAACSGGSPSGPSAVEPNPAARDSVAGASGGVSTTGNSPPVVEMRTTPRRVDGVVAGFLPLDVKINMCKSTDPDEGDSLKFNVNWGDGIQTGQHHPGAGTDLGDGGPPTGCGGPACCRHRHRFDSAGTFTVTVEVSDKHISDQGGDVEALAISTATFIVKAGSAAQEPAFDTTGSLTTQFTGGNGQSGNMFDVTAKTTIKITGFDLHIGATTSQTVEVYWRNGTSVGNENSAAGWTLLGTQTVTGAGAGNPTPVSIGGLTVAAGQTVGLYVTLTTSTAIDYTNGALTVQNSDLTLVTNSGNAYPFGGVFQPRIWNGTIYYVK